MLDPFSAYKYDQKADQGDFPIFENISFVGPLTSIGPRGGPTNIFDPKNHFNVHQMAKLELQNHFRYILNVLRPCIQRGSRAQMTDKVLQRISNNGQTTFRIHFSQFKGISSNILLGI